MAAPASHGREPTRGRSWPLIFVAILAVHSLAIFLFTRGFLLTRTELDLHSHRDDRTGVSPGCSAWPPPAIDRLVIVVLDALRYRHRAFPGPSQFPGLILSNLSLLSYRFDFVAPSTFFEGGLALHTDLLLSCEKKNENIVELVMSKP
jgi:hypothetical protein